MWREGQQQPPFGLAGRYPLVRRTLGLAMVGLGIALLLTEGLGARGWSTISSCSMVAAGALLWTNYWIAGAWLVYSGFGLYWIAIGLLEQKTYSIVFGIVILSLIGLALVLASLQAVRRARANRSAGTQPDS